MCGLGAWVVDGPGAHAAYCTSKLAQARLVEHVANSYADQGLLAIAVHPGGVWTASSRHAPPEFHASESGSALFSVLGRRVHVGTGLMMRA